MSILHARSGRQMTPCVRSSTAWAAALVSRPNPLHGPADQSAITGDATVKSVPPSAFEAAERPDARGTPDVRVQPSGGCFDLLEVCRAAKGAQVVAALNPQ